ncbi:sigma-54-dependent Fis family transcriptional regulator [Vagococcus elongatus]|uniref:Sigma-54 factor interaction domain-containing protein n=1 Tax=Vagococcus elongatus TaxID=180344 RepID=A0A430B608_9ENTE|nr:sigma-54-dependent Fis family transcriptional regulator [Vagococcus elongatus]RSU15727.1 hypothetical protein CBF29_01250 [Vagococcus elongatus]
MLSVEKMWETYVKSSDTEQLSLPELISESWQYCLKENVNPYLNRGTEAVSQTSLITLKKDMSMLIDIIKYELSRLNEFLRVKKPLFILTDKNGVVIWRDGNDSTRHQANDINFTEGNVWTEKAVGTNAIGIALRTIESVTVEKFEHFAKASHPFTCSSTPILDPEGEVVACLNVSTMEEVSDANYTMLAMQMIAKNVQQTLMLNYFENRKQELLDAMKTPFVNGILCDTKMRVAGLSKDFDKEERQWLGQSVDSLLAECQGDYRQRLLMRNEQLIGYYFQFSRQNKPNDYVTFGIESKNRQYRIFLNQLIRAAESDLPIHIYGETGSGKEVAAKTVHFNSRRRKGQLVSVNCGSLSESLLESELFGYVAGAFTGAQSKGYKGKIEQADGGTLFLDEVDSMSPRMQVALLRALEEKKVTPLGSEKEIHSDFRVVTASNRDLKRLVQEGKFREDLFYRLYVVPLTLPPLRKRQEDLYELAEHFCLAKNWEPDWMDEVINIARTYEWAGNIREFQNFLERLYVFYPFSAPPEKKVHEMIQIGTVKKEIPAEASSEPLNERDRITQMFKETNYHLSQTAERLGMARSTLYRKLDKYHIDVNKKSASS